MNGIYYNAQMQPISVVEANEILSKQDAVFCKEAEDSSGGDGVRYIDRTGGSRRCLLGCGKEVGKGCYCPKTVISV